MLTGHAKEKFEEWGIKNGYAITHTIYKNSTARIEKSFNTYLYKRPLSEQIGVIEDFAESLGYLIWHGKVDGTFGNIWYFLEIEKDGLVFFNDHFNTKKESRNEVINQLNKLINKVK